MALYASGMTTRNIAEQVKNLYDVEISAEMVSNITNRIIPLVTEWQNRPLEKTYSFVFMDCIHYKVRTQQMNNLKVLNKKSIQPMIRYSEIPRQLIP